MKTKVFLLFFSTFLLLIGCRKDQTSWNTDWVVPIINDSLLIVDYVNDSSLAVNPDQSIQVVLDRKLFDIDLSDLVSIPDTTVEQTFQLQLQSLIVNPGFTFINEVEEHSFVFDEMTLLEARIKSGLASVRIENPVATNAIFEVSLPGVTKNGAVFSHSQVVEGGTQANPGVGFLSLDLSGYTVDMRGVNGNLYNLLQSKLVVTSDPEGQQVTITNQDEFKFEVSFENLKIDYGRGYFGNLIFTDTLTTGIDELRKVIGGNIEIDDLNLELIVSNGIKASGQANITLFESVNNNQNHVVSLTHPYFGQHLNLNAAQGMWETLTPSELKFLFNNTSGNLKDFFENLGDEYNLGYSIEINPYGNSSAGNDMVFPKSSIGVALKADFPLKVGADNLIIQDTFKIDFKNDNKLINVHSGEFVLKSINTFPYGLDVELDLLDEENQVMKSLVAQGSITAASTNSSLGFHDPVENEVRFIVDEATAKLLTDTKSILVRAKFKSTFLNNNTIYSNAAFKFVLLSHLKLKTTL